MGTEKEILARKYLEQNGYYILCTNYRCKFGEIDIIAKDGNNLVFIEVKYRSTIKFGAPIEAVDLYKQRKLYKVGYYFLKENKQFCKLEIRFDVVAILNRDIIVYKSAFGGI